MVLGVEKRKASGRVASVAMVLLVAITCAWAAPSVVLRGHVRDVTGAAIEDATVRVGDVVTHTGAGGEFAIAIDEERLQTTAPLRLEVSAPGFLAAEAPAGSGEVVITLAVSTVESRVSVTAAGVTTPDATVLTSADLARAPVLGLDEALRQVPGFSLFRRTPSWSANPTTQGVSLRGVGASGASRGLVLMDGVPLNDPFGGWVYWGRVPPGTLREAEVVEGSASELYGTDAVGGVVNLAREQTSPATVAQLSTSLGNLATPDGTANLAHRWGRWETGAAAGLFRTNGYIPVPAESRGLVDVPVNSRSSETWVGVVRTFGTAQEGGRVSLTGELYGEDRHNGTRLQTNGATVRTLTLGAEHNGAAGAFSVRAWGGTENLRQTFTAVAQDRNSENLARDQSVPVSQAGVTAVWSRTVLRRHNVVAGAEARWVEGESAEWAFAQQQITQQLRNGGAQRREAVFGEDRVRLGGRVLVSAALRLDHWANYGGFSSTRTLSTGATTRTTIGDRSGTAASPKLAISWNAAQRLALYASAAKAFRTPTLNELYRSFRVGNVVTQANPDLRAERATSVEGGAVFEANSRLHLKAGYWWLAMTQPVTNVTLTSTPALITRRRENLGRLDSHGVFAGGEWKFSERLQLRAAYQFANAVVAEFPANQALVGNWIPQVARHNASAQLLLKPMRKTVLSLDARWHGLQYDDDLNQFPLAGYAWLGGQLSREISERAEVFASAQNILNKRYEVGRTPTVTVGPPVVAMAGVRWRFQHQ